MTTKITKSESAEELYTDLCEQYEDFAEVCFESLDPSIIEGKDRAYAVFEQLEYSEIWTFFWTGDQYLFFPCNEDALITGMRELEDKFSHGGFDGGEEEKVDEKASWYVDLTESENTKYIVEKSR